MLLVLEVMLTVSAWKRGWHGWALLPLGIGFIIAIWAGVTLESTDFLTFIDIAVVLVLAVMTAKARKVQPKTTNAHMISKPVDNINKTTLPGDYTTQNSGSHVRS